MKYFPLIWAALRRKPIRTGVTFLSVTVAFTLFGLMIGLNATMDMMKQRAHADRIWTLARFETTGLPITVARQIAELPGIKKNSVMIYLAGYVGDPKNRAFVIFFDDEYGKIFPDQVPPQQADLIRHDRTAVVMNRMAAEALHKKVGDRFTIISPQTNRADGSKNWPFKIAGIYDDIPQFPGPMISANYEYYDKSVPLAEQGKINEVDSLAADPAQAAALAERIDSLFANSGTPTRSQTEKQIYSQGFGDINVEALTRKIALIGLLMIVMLTANVIAQSVRERLAEFATLKTFGFSNTRLIGLVMAEAAFPSLLGALCGLVLARWLALQLPAVLPPGTGIPAPTMTSAVFLWALVCACGLAMASTVLPIARLSRLDIAAALSRSA
ncbi:MAG TPA: FtsX-like permease family protein [Rhizomicrobium sp.]|nr:FtsX-like permease family protein [Rhizomicrobium sp.]